ncbi:MAG: hypothetical protein JWR86_828 [Enterovirga sp.]|nr:hypothetical protein [Enterovirga sp.]
MTALGASLGSRIGARPRVAGPGATRVSDIILADTVTKLSDVHRGCVLVCGSHGGVYAGYCAAKGGVRAVILNDAGIGKDRAGIGSLAFLDRIGLAAATADTRTCRIGEAGGMLDDGSISHVNAAAAALGCAAGQSVAECAALMRAAPMPSGPPPSVAEARFVLRDLAGEPFVVGIDSVSLWQPDDAGRILVTGSHGGRLGRQPDRSVPDGVLVATYHDAGGGRDGAGWTRLPDLDARGIAGATVAGDTARVGDARSCYEDGVLSHLNPTAERLGARIGMRLGAWVDGLVAARAGAAA